MSKSLHKKLLVGMLLVTVIPIIISTIITYQSTSETIEKNLVNSNQQLMEVGMDNLVYYFRELDQMSLSWTFDEELMNDLDHQTLNFQQEQNLEYEIKNLLYQNPNISRVQYSVDNTGDTYYSERNVYLQQKQRVDDLRKKMGDRYRVFELKKYQDEVALVLHRKIVSVPDREVLGYLSIYTHVDELDAFLQRLYEEDENMFLFIESNNTISSYSSEHPNQVNDESVLSILTDSIKDNGQTSGSLDMEVNQEDGTALFHQDQYEDLSLTLVKFIPFTIIAEEAQSPLQQIAIVQMITVLVIIFFIYFVSISITRPIHRLMKNIRSIEKGDFEVKEKGVKREDELGLLEERFSSMVGRLNQLVNKEMRLQMEVTTAQLKMLQAQINPHFLYNTLQSIGTIALKHKLPDVYQRLISLSSLFRYSMDLKNKRVPLAKEVEMIDEYLYLQKGRFGDRLEYDIRCTDESLQIEVPKMVLQPLVENSIVHGIERGNQVGRIQISSQLDENMFQLEVSDNGPGFSVEKIAELQNMYKSKEVLSENRQGGIGLMNVLFRLYYEYGDSFTWTIDSEPFENTVLRLYISIKEGDVTRESINRG
ncbi:sensor histidine kinase [Salinibacillus xinjiangensis]|uniref:HAMP domain-containing protein n=1 Tax=Salinibacillus xinjiangensis TaxID=1229268 RepID=A0A6G1XA27_9BACI|nr:sensor histidine kinase [Salinibacillus xinjiangensis]MRG87863.1 HAMP domain-containing protein [Salinibacillus xinjiangensis]